VRDNIFSSKGIHVGIVDGRAIFDLNGQKPLRSQRDKNLPTDW